LKARQASPRNLTAAAALSWRRRSAGDGLEERRESRQQAQQAGRTQQRSAAKARAIAAGWRRSDGFHGRDGFHAREYSLQP
jgi:hypothetical protein